MPEQKSQRVNLRAPSPQYANHDVATLPHPSASGGNAVRAWVSFQTEHLAQPDTLLDPGIAAHSLSHSSFSLPPPLPHHIFPVSLLLASHRLHPSNNRNSNHNGTQSSPPLPSGQSPESKLLRDPQFPCPFLSLPTRKSDDIEEIANRSELP